MGRSCRTITLILSKAVFSKKVMVFKHFPNFVTSSPCTIFLTSTLYLEHRTFKFCEIFKIVVLYYTFFRLLLINSLIVKDMLWNFDQLHNPCINAILMKLDQWLLACIFSKIICEIPCRIITLQIAMMRYCGDFLDDRCSHRSIL